MADDNGMKHQGHTNQYALVWNYYNQVKEVHNHFGEAASRDDLAETDADKRKRLELTRTNKVLRLEGVDVLRLFRFIEKHFVRDVAHKYEWYALRRFLERNKYLEACDNKAFAEHMNQEEWYGHAKKGCDNNEINTYNFLVSVVPDRWPDSQIPYGSKATPSGLKRLYEVFHELEDNKGEIDS